MPNGAEERSGREVRLLVLVIAIAIAGLLVLARFRFPTADIVAVAPAPSPLERVVPKPPFEELARTVAEATARITPFLVVVEFGRVADRPGRKSAPGVAAAPESRLFAGLRVRPDAVLSYHPSKWQPSTVAGLPALPLAGDASRNLVLVGVDNRTGEHTLPSGNVTDLESAVQTLAAPSFVLAVEGAPGGPAVRPVFIPRADPISDDRWPLPGLRIGGDPPVGAGAFLFTIDGHLVGLTVPDDGGLVILTGPSLARLVAGLSSGHQ